MPGTALPAEDEAKYARDEARSGTAAAAPRDEGSQPPPGYAAVDPAAPPADAFVESAAPAGMPMQHEAGDSDSGSGEWRPRAAEDEFSPFADRDEEEEQRSPLGKLLMAGLVLALLGVAFWFLAPVELKARLGLAEGSRTQLQLMMTHSDRQQLASGNELLAVSGRVINPTDKSQPVPPIQAQLRSAAGQLVYSWTIAPPAPTLAPGQSATFNSAEVNVPAGGDELTISLGPPRA